MNGRLGRWRRRAQWASTVALPVVVASNVWFLTDGWGDTPPVEHDRIESTSEPAHPPPPAAPLLDVAAELGTAEQTPRIPLPAGAPARVAFLGDSVAWSTASAVSSFAGHYGIEVVNAGIWGCGTVRGTPFRYFGSTYESLPNDCDHWPAQWQRAIDFAQPHVAVVMVGRWELMDRVHRGRWTHVGDPSFDAYLGRELDLAITIAGSRGARVVVATTPYYRRGDGPGGGTWPEDEPHRVDEVNALLRAAAARNRVGIVDYGALLSPGGALAMDIDGFRVRSDGVHIAVGSGPWMAPRLLPAIRTAAGI
ncbi:MAG TPA: SGNH hydrolase domain-containing protein [Acidimicrobiales bacterium]|nr:SGNH hydrolase domain-containing protein [Acidimicrobiales bacterium]